MVNFVSAYHHANWHALGGGFLLDQNSLKTDHLRPILARKAAGTADAIDCPVGETQTLGGCKDGFVRSEYHSCGFGFGVFFVDALVREPYAFQLPFPNATKALLLHVVTSGKGRLILDKGMAIPGSAGDAVFSVPESGGYVVEPAHGVSYSMLASVMCVERFITTFSQQMLPAPLNEFLTGRRSNLIRCSAPSHVIQRLTKEMQANPYRGPVATLYLESKMLELLAEVMAQFDSNQETSARVLSCERRRAVAARDVLIDNLSNPPSVSALAQTVGLSQRRLNYIFRELYGGTVFSCMTQWRLARARELLEEGSLSVKQVASTMGYAHANNFILAFTRNFGVSPGKCRKEYGG